ncbi:MAG TPA: glycosyltransferase family 2 protein [Gammaproteobacteria bacterium]|nr:glycosyltransferase family 2 protein [Gammaproteobacteria bacterium]
MSKVSFVVPVYNVPLAYLSSCLYSIIEGAKHLDHEIIVCDDGSNKVYSDLYGKLIASLSDIVFISLGSNKGINHARNACLDVSNGDWIALVDADDAVTSDFGMQIKPYLSKDFALIYADHIQYRQDLIHPIQVRKKRIYNNLLQEYGGSEMDPLLWSTFIFHPQIFNKDALVCVNGFNTRYSSGDEVAAHIAISEIFGKESLFHIPDFLYKYRKNTESVVHDGKYYNELISNIESILSHYFSKRSGFKSIAQRIGRCTSTQAAHYSHVPVGGKPVCLPWFDSRSMSISYNKRL